MIEYLKSLQQPKNVKYGTAGFRDHHSKLDYIVYAVGRVAALRSCHQKKAIGIMLTASHNPAEDNGVKIVDPSGHMLETKWEQYATDMVNLDMDTVINDIIAKESIDTSLKPTVIIARDTRTSGPRLFSHIKQALKDSKATVFDLDCLTTPQLHWATLYFNTHNTIDNVEQEYYKTICSNFNVLVKDLKNARISCAVDGSNGIGAPKLALCIHMMQHYIPNYKMHQFNGAESPNDILNFNCGADYVKTTQKQPANILETPIAHGQLGASFDGDADRIVFHFIKDNKFHVLDGDRIIALCAKGIQKLITELKIECSMGIVQTAYANGNATKYLKNLGLPVSFTPTGVKHLHHKAEEYDVGIYFEANGHGTVLFSEKLKKIDNVLLQALISLVNQTTGDAISDLFMVLFLMQYLNCSHEDWYELYTECPSTLIKVVVKDRYAFKTVNAEQTLTHPEGIQAKMDQLMATMGGRSFVRPSGTENVVRVYAEHDNKEKCMELGNRVAGIVFDACGLGEKPKEFK